MSVVTFSAEVKEKFRVALTWRFILYSIFVYVGGALGVFFIWYEVANETPMTYSFFKIAEGLATFFVPLVGACIAEIFISPKIFNKIAFSLISLLVYGGSFALLWWTYHLKNNYAFWPAFIGIVLSLFYWVIAYADEEKFSEENFYSKMKGNYDKFRKRK